MGGSKLANNDGATLETGTTAVTINGGIFGTEGKTNAYELVMGGNYIKTGTGASGTATTNGSSVTVNGGTFHASVVGGSVAHNYSGAGITNVFDNGNTSVTITGGTFNSSESSLTDGQGGINLSAAVIGGGLAYGANTSTVLGSDAQDVTSRVSISGDAQVNGKVVAGSVVANGGYSAIVHGDTLLSMSGGTVNDDLVGGGMVQDAAPLSGEKPDSNLIVTGNAGVMVAGGTAKGEIVGGNYVRGNGSARVKNSSVTITSGKFANVDDSTNKAQYIIGGSKTNASEGGNATTLVEGNSSVRIDGDVDIKDGALIGGSQAKAGNGVDSKATATVKGNSSVTVNNGKLAGVVGGGIAETYYSTTATAESTVDGTSFVAINGGTIEGIAYGAVAAGKSSAAVVGGGLANTTGSTATVGSTSVAIATGTINGKVVAGGLAINGGTTTAGGNTLLTMTDGAVSGDLIGGNLLEKGGKEGSAIAGSTVNVEGGTVAGEIYGGSYVRNTAAMSEVDNTTVNISGGTIGATEPQGWAQYVVGGGKAMSNATTTKSSVMGTAAVNISGGDITRGAVVGGGFARAQGANGSATANVKDSVVNLTGGSLVGVVGGGLAENLGTTSSTATATAEVTTASLTIDGNATVNDIIYKGNDAGNTSPSAAVIGGGLAYSKNGSKATASVGTANTIINGGTINGDVYAGGMADGANAQANVDNASLTIKGGTINGNVYAGGYALNEGRANVTTANVTLKGGSIKGKVTVGNATEATITLDGTGAKVTGDDTGDFEGNESSTLAFNNYNGTFEDVAIGFGTLAVAENSNVYVDALVSGQRGSDRPNTGIFGAPTPGEGSGPVVTHPLTITGGGTITANEFHVNPDASVTIEHGNVVADDVKVQGAILTVGKGSASAGFTANNDLSFEQSGDKLPSIVINNLGTATLSQTVVLNDEGKIDTTLFDNDQIQVNTGGTLRLDGLEGPLTEDELAALKATTKGGLLDLGGADLGVTPGPDGTVSYDKLQGITTDSLKDTTVAVTDAQNEDGISGGFQAVKLTENDKELNAKNTLGLAGSQNGGALVMDKDGNVADLRVGGALGSQDTSVVTLGLADANNTGAVNTVTMNAGTGNDATLNVIGAGAAEFTIGDIRANSSTNTINVQGATLNTGNITTEAVSPATLDDMNITNGTVKAAGDAEIKNVTLDNGLLQAVATTGDTPAGGDITIDSNLSGQGAVVADKTLTLQEAYTGKEGDDLTLQADTLKTDAIDSITGDLTIAATNLVTSGETKLVDDTLVADNVALGGALTASGASLVQVQDFGKYETSSGTFTPGALDQAVSVQDTSLMAYGADLAQAQQAVAETGHTGAAYYAGKTLTLTTGGSLTVGNATATNTTVAFGSDSLLVVDGTAMNDKTVFTGEEASPNLTASVDAGSKLHVDNAVAGGFTVFGEGFKELASGWTDDNVTTDSAMLDASYDATNSNVTVKTNNAHTVFPNLSDGMADAVNDLYNGKLNNVDSTDMGVRFLSRATNDHFLGADKDAAAATIESAARIAFAGAVPQMTKMASDAGTNAVVNRLGFANPADGAQAMDAEGKIVDRNTTGFALWIAPLWQSQHGWGMEADNLDYGFNGNLGGVSLGADYTFENAIRAGITFNIGGGYAESSGGDLSSTENRMNFWGLGAYAGWNYENFGLMADVSYTSTWNDLKQDMDSRMGMGDLEADVQASAISAGLRAEYKLETSVLDVIPHIGVRYMSLNTWGFDAESNGGTVLEGDGFHQDIWTFPVGVTFTKDFTLDSGWSFKPSIDFSVIPAAGDIKAKQDVAFTGLPGSYEVETQMMDYLTWQGGVGLEMGNDTMSFGVNYTLQAGQHTTGHGVFGSFRYEF
ncbi:autotransporter domain-containing protein [uncultured Desulfovibrio sp.]|uniref:autotransporter domain-containing protein n=1 Tax=uncultured Desulfovibrio sp. TaxID=167968 RepID=UPI0026272C2B|nr:autotransporter domain-containing protein [uncultured Desulfovibrio sp.]